MSQVNATEVDPDEYEDEGLLGDESEFDDPDEFDDDDFEDDEDED